MLSRNDLVKQFEIVTKQEIVNHNKAIAQTNATIDEIKHELDNHTRTTEKHRAENNSEVKLLCISLERLDQSLNNNLKNNVINFQEQYEIQKKIIDDCINRINIFHERINVIVGDLTSINALDIVGNFNKINSRVNDIQQDLKLNFDRSFFCFQEEIQSIKKELSYKPTEAEKIKDELKGKIESHRVDQQTLLREMRSIRQSHLVIEKSIEALFTLSEKMKEKLEEMLCHKPA